MKCQSLFSIKDKKNIISMSSAVLVTVQIKIVADNSLVFKRNIFQRK